MSARQIRALALAGVIALTGCTSASAHDIRQLFSDAGGECASWTEVVDTRAVDALVCSAGAKIYLFDDDAERADFVKTELESNTDIRSRTHIMLSGENWLIIDRIATIVRVMPRMHGIIQGRNGANP